MKKGNFYSGAFIALAMGALVGCSKDDDGTAKVTPDMTTSYANISIVMPNHAGTRALETPDNGTQTDPNYSNNGENFEYGTDAENKIGDILLVFYDAQGNVVGSSSPEKLGDKTHPGGSVATMYSNTVAINLNEGANMPASVMAYINPANTTSQNDRLDRVKTLTRDQYFNDNGFLMNNSGYYDGNAYKLASDINSSFIFATEEEAKASKNKTITIYVERVAAKVKLALDDTNIENFAVVDKDGNQTYSLKFVPKGWALTATANKTMLLKNLNPTTADLAQALNGNSGWVMGPNRTYWARSYGYGKEGIPGNAAETNFPVVGTDNGTDYLLSYITYDSEYKTIEKQFGDNAVYTFENTMRKERITDSKFKNPYAGVTSAVIKGEYEVIGDNDGKFDDGFYLRMYSKVENDETKQVYAIYTEDELITAMLAGQSIIRTTADGTEGINDMIEIAHNNEIPDFSGELIDNPANRVTIRVKANSPIYVNDNGTWKPIEDTDRTIDDINKELQNFAGQAMAYTNRKAFFYVPIKHNAANGTELFMDDPATGDYGIVRNHSYQITIEKIQGLAIGVRDNEKLLPEPRSTQSYYINASMNVLAWHIMSQSVIL